MRNNQLSWPERQVTEILNFILEQYKNENILQNMEVCSEIILIARILHQRFKKANGISVKKNYSVELAKKGILKEIKDDDYYDLIKNFIKDYKEFGEKNNHKIKILISSSNWPRYQSCANVPIEQGDFFRRNPGDGKTYSFNSIIYSPRIASQEINFSPSYPSQITFPLYYSAYGLTIEENNFNIDNNWNIFPNPVNDKLTLTSNLIGSYDVKIISITGEIIKIKMNQNNNLSMVVLTQNNL